MIPYGKHYIDKDDIKSVCKVLKSKDLTQGPIVKKFENSICKYVGSKFAVAVSSCTAGLHLAAIVAKNLKKGSLLTSPISFVSTANSSIFTGGKTIFADIDKDTANLSAEEVKKLLKKKNIGSIAPVHFGGLPANMKLIKKINSKNKAIIYEDAAHAFGARYDDKNLVGCCKYSDMTVFSFHPVKSIAMGEGGCITTNNKKIYKKLINLRNHGIEKNPKYFFNKKQKKNHLWYYEMQELGYHYRVTDIQCALGLSQLKKINIFLNKRTQIAKIYDFHFKNLNNAFPLHFNKRKYSSNHLYVLLINFKKIKKNRSQLMSEFKKAGIITQLHYIPITNHPFYKKKFNQKKLLKNTEEYYNRALSIPIFYSLKRKEQNHIIKVVKKLIG